MPKELTYKEYNKKSFALYGNKSKYSDLVKQIGGRWNSRMKGGDGPGWLVPRENLKKIKDLMKLFNSTSPNTGTSTGPSPKPSSPKVEIKSRKGQKKYHREVSEKNYEDSDVEESNEVSHKEESNEVSHKEESNEVSHKEDIYIEESKEVGGHSKNIETRNVSRSKRSSEKLKKEKAEYDKYLKKELSTERNVVKQYKTFSKPPTKFKELYSEESEDLLSSSSDDSSDESSDDFPSPNTPKKKMHERNEDYENLTEKINDLQKRLYCMERKKHKSG